MMPKIVVNDMVALIPPESTHRNSPTDDFSLYKQSKSFALASLSQWMPFGKIWGEILPDLKDQVSKGSRGSQGIE